ncbi:MAG: GDYXXLXY domain-containing protein [Rhizobiaceae bacterium]
MSGPSSKYIFAALVAVLHTGVLGYMIESRASILRNGREVVLATVPVDPRDLMRGDYVVLGYPISQIDFKLIAGAQPASDDIKPVYLTLAPGENGRHVFSRASWVPFADTKPEEIMLVGKTLAFNYADSQTVNLTFGIERFYVPEGEGRPIEEGVREESVDVVVAVDSKGKAQVKSLRLDGSVLYDEPLY